MALVATVAAAVRKRAAQGPRSPTQEAAVGPQHSPSPPSGRLDITPAAAPATPPLARPVRSEGDWAGKRRQEQAGRRRRGNSTAPLCPDVSGGVQGAGRCPNVCDQLYATCPVPTDLPMGTLPPLGGPVGSDPPKLPLLLLTPRDVLTAVGNGTLTVVDAAAQQAGAALAAEQAAASASPADSPRLNLTGRNATRAASAEQGNNINAGDSWAIRNQNCQIAPIHGIMNRYNKFIMIDRIWFTATGQNPNPYGILASEYDVTTDTFRDLSAGIISNSWCSAGDVLFGGAVVNLGGGGDEPTPNPNGGGDSVRTLQSCGDSSCQFVENQADPSQRLLAYRWYPTAVKNWDGRLLVASGLDLDENSGYKGDSYEFWPRYNNEGDLSQLRTPVNLNTNPCYRSDGSVQYGPRPTYPHVHLLPTFEFFVVSCNQWWVGYMLGPGESYLNKGPGYLDPRWPDGGTPVTYPGFGTSFLLPIYPPYTSVTVVLCGATWGYNSVNSVVDPDCAVITPTDPNPVSSRATGLTMINKRIMPYCIALLDGNVVCMMGAESGFSGYYSAINPQLQVDLLNTTTMTFSTGATATVPRMYHSVASLVPSGAVITAGSNPQGSYYFQSDPATGVYPAELRVEYYYPWYFSCPRPVLTAVTGANGANSFPQGSTVTVSAQLPALTNAQSVAVIMPGFSTHSLMMSQRYVVLDCSCGMPAAVKAGANQYAAVVTCSCTIPSNYAVTPAGDYLITLLDGGVPSEAVWISIG